MNNKYSKHLDDLRKALNDIADKGWVLASRSGYTGIGKTLEDLLEKEEHNLSLPDFEDIEIKSKDKLSNSLITLFTKSPTYPRGANSRLADKYGYYETDEYDRKYDYKSFFATVSGKTPTTSDQLNKQLSIKVDKTDKKIYLVIKDKQGNKIINNETYWSFDDIEKVLNEKLKYICIVHADKRKNNKGEYEFNYNDFTLIYDLTIDSFIQGIIDGAILIDTRVGISKSRRKRHDHGTGFRISYSNLEKYAKKFIIT